jgi:hypothetical protein
MRLNYGRKVYMNKKIRIIAILLAIVVASSSIYAANIVLRQTQTLKGSGGELTLYSNGTAEFWVNGYSGKGKYSIENYLRLYETDGTEVYACRYAWFQKGQSLLWVEIDGVRLNR